MDYICLSHRMSGFPMRLRFLDRKQSIKAYASKVALSSKFRTDRLGFSRTIKEILHEQEVHSSKSRSYMVRYNNHIN